MKKNKGITITSLVVTVVVLLILATIGTIAGKNSIENARFTTYGVELQSLQMKVNELEQQYQYGNTDVLGYGEPLTNSTQEFNAFAGAGIGDRTDYRKYTKDTLNSINLVNFNQEFLVNVKTRSVISLNGIKYKGVIYWTLEQLPGGVYNVN